MSSSNINPPIKPNQGWNVGAGNNDERPVAVDVKRYRSKTDLPDAGGGVGVQVLGSALFISDEYTYHGEHGLVQNLRARPLNLGAFIQWNQSVLGSPDNGYTITVNNEIVANVGGDTFEYRVNNLLNGSEYVIGVYSDPRSITTVNVTPISLPSVISDISNLVTWLDATTISGASNGAALAAWGDRSGNGNNATQSGANKPTYLNAANGINGVPAVNFSGGNAPSADQKFSLDLYLTKYHPTSKKISAGITPTIFIVININSLTNTAGANDCKILSNQSASSSEHLMFDIGSGTLRYESNNKAIYSPAPAVLANVPYVLSITMPGSVYINGAKQAARLNALAEDTVKPLFLGGPAIASSNKCVNAKIGDFIVFNRRLSHDERHAVESYLFSKYAISGVQQ